MDIRKIKKLIELVEESGIAELEISEGEESVRISRNFSGSCVFQSRSLWVQFDDSERTGEGWVECDLVE